MSTLIRRDPFARGAYRRYATFQHTLPEAERADCHWCGNRPGRLYSYVWESDSACVPSLPRHGWFCNFTCHFNYHD